MKQTGLDLIQFIIVRGEKRVFFSAQRWKIKCLINTLTNCTFKLLLESSSCKEYFVSVLSAVFIVESLVGMLAVFEIQKIHLMKFNFCMPAIEMKLVTFMKSIFSTNPISKLSSSVNITVE